MQVAALSMLAGLHYTPIKNLSQSAALKPRKYQGVNLSGFETVLGDALYTAPGETLPTIDDIESVHYKKRSELRANVHVRRIMAHCIAFKRVITPSALSYRHKVTYQFRLPYSPSTANAGLNGETVEGHIAVWDGVARLDHITGWQWVVNPWATTFGDLNMWIGGTWVKVGHHVPDTRWHTVTMILDIRRGRARIIFDGTVYKGPATVMTRPADWGGEIAARLAAEAVSLWPGESGAGALHRAQFRNWVWNWNPY